MKFQRLLAALFSACLLAACAGGGDGPPGSFLDLPLSHGDAADTSTCYTVRQLADIQVKEFARHDWKKIDDDTWQFNGQEKLMSTPDSFGRYVFHRKGGVVDIADWELKIKESVRWHDPEEKLLYVKMEVSALKMGGAKPIAGCPDSSHAELKPAA